MKDSQSRVALIGEDIAEDAEEIGRAGVMQQLPSCLPPRLRLAQVYAVYRCRQTMVNKEDYYSATVNATVLDHKGNPQQMVTKNDGRYGQNSPKTEAKGIVIAPAAVNGGERVYIYILIFKQVCKKKIALRLFTYQS